MAHDADSLTRFVFAGAAVRGGHVSLAATTRSILACHEYPPSLARAIGEMCAAMALLSGAIKFEGRVIAQLSGDGPVRLLVVESDRGALRATAQWDAPRVAALGDDAGLAALAADGDNARLSLTLAPDEGPSYQGVVALQSASVAAMIEHYLATSEQVASRMRVAFDDGAASGVLVQRMPGAGADDDAAWRRAVAGLDAASAADLRPGRPAHIVLATAFADDDLRLMPATPVVFRCKCSDARVARALRIAGRDEIEAAIAERGDVEVACEFCGKRFNFAPDAARALFDAALSPHH